MSKYTTEVRYICEMNSGFPVEEMSSHTPDQIIAASRSKIFDFSYPIYDSGHRAELETKILKHYYTREIGAETVALWKLWLNERMNLIMPKYNKLYKIEAESIGKEFRNIDVETHSLREDDYTKDSDYTRTDNLTDSSDHTRTDNLTDRSDHTHTDNLTVASSNTRTDNLTVANNHTRTDNLTDSIEEDTTGSVSRQSIDKFSDTPQGTVANVNNDTYLTEYRTVTETETTTGGKTASQTHTGTQTNAGTEQHTGTQNNAGTEQHTGTQNNAGTEQHTGTQKNVGTVDHTGTQRNAGTDKNYGDQEVNAWERGYRGTKLYGELLLEYADKVLNIDNMIINDLRDLFILLW